MPGPHVAEHMLELRYALGALRDRELRSEVRTHFYRLLNEEQEAESA